MSYSAGLLIIDSLTVDEVNSGVIKASKINFTNLETQNLNVSGLATVVAPNSNSNTNQIATTAFVQNKIDGILGNAPELLNTLGEIAVSLGNNTNLSTTLTNNLATKAPLVAPVFTGIPQAPTASNEINNTQIATTEYVNNLLNVFKDQINSLI
jgi:hypothetical protein